MIAFIYWVLRGLKKDVVFLSNLRKSHRHFFWFMGLDAFLSAQR